MSRTEAITNLAQILTGLTRGCEERMGDQRGTNEVAPWLSIVAAAVGEKAHLGTKLRCKIKSLALAVLELYLSVSN